MKARSKLIGVIFLILTVIILLMLGISSFLRDPHISAKNDCISNLRWIDAAKQQWASEHQKINGPVTWNDILPYFARPGLKPEIPHCPEGGTYTPGNVEEDPKCSVAGHKLL